MKKTALLCLILILGSLFSGLGVAQAAYQISISPTNPAADQPLTCLVDGAVQNFFQYNWRVNPGPNNAGTPIYPNNPNIPNPWVLPESFTSPGDTVSCEVTFVGTRAFFHNNNVASVTVQGARPTPTNQLDVVITPPNPVETVDVQCWERNPVNGLLKVDTQNKIYVWSINNGPLLPLSSTNGPFDNNRDNILSNTLFNTGDVVRCQIEYLVAQGTSLGSASVTIGRTQPPVVVGNAPVISPIPDQTVVVAQSVILNLDDFVSDVENTDDQLIWTVSGTGPVTANLIGRNNLQLTGTNVGVATMTVRVVDTDRNVAVDSFDVTVRDTIIQPNVGVNVVNLRTFSDSAFSQADNDFFRAEDLFAGFSIVSQNGNPVLNARIERVELTDPSGLVTRAVLVPYNGPLGSREGNPRFDDIENGQLRPWCLFVPICMGGPNGNYYYELPRIPIRDDVLGQNSVLVVTLASANQGVSQRQQVAVTINNNVPVISPIPDQTVRRGEFAVVLLDEFVRDVEDEDPFLTWTASGSGPITLELFGRNLRVTGTNAGTATVTVRVVDTDNGVATDSFVVTTQDIVQPNNFAPEAVIGVDRTTASQGNPITFTSLSTDRDGVIIREVWAFGDGVVEQGRVVPHAYNADGRFTVCLTVTDDDSLTDRECTVVTVSTDPISVIDDPDEGKPRQFAWMNIDTHDFKIKRVQLFPYKQAYNPGDVIQVFAGIKNNGLEAENLELRMVVPGFEVPMTGADQRISVSDSRVNRELLLVIPQGTKPGLYTGKITAYNGESERVSEYFTFNVA